MSWAFFPSLTIHRKAAPVLWEMRRHQRTIHKNEALRRMRAWLCLWVRLELRWTRRSSNFPLVALATPLAHTTRPFPQQAPT